MLILHYDYCALVVFLVIMLSMLIRKVIRGHTNRTFFIIVLLSLIASTADILSESLFVAAGLRLFFDYVYFLCMLFIPLNYALYVYASIGLWNHVIKQEKIWVVFSIPLVLCLITLVANLFTNCAFYINEDGTYMRGPLQVLLIICNFTYIIAGMMIILKWRKIISRERIVALVLMFPIVVISIVLQQINKGLEVTMFGLAISELIIAFTVQRVDENYDSITGTKNFDLALQDFKKVFLSNQNVDVIFIQILDQSTLRQLFGATSYNKLLKILSDEFIKILKNYESYCELYYLHTSTYAVKVESLESETVINLAQAIADRLKQPFLIEKISFSTNSKVCIVKVPEDIDNMDALLNFRYNFQKKLPDTPDAQILSKLMNSRDFKIQNDLSEIIQRAISNHNFQLYYQPIYSVKEKKFVSAEALIRLFDNKYGMISPAIFIPEAETSGAIHQIGDYVINSVCKFIAESDSTKFGLNYIELNLSVSQCIEPDLVSKFENAIAKYSLNPSQLNLEITETAENFNAKIMDSNIDRLHKLGFEFSLDDYGTGYSNIKRVTQLPIDIVKLDKSFVDDMDKPEMWSVIVNTVKMFKEMNKIILVEGIENQEALDAFINLGCDYIQGYYFSKPLPEKEFLEFLKNKNSVSE